MKRWCSAPMDYPLTEQQKEIVAAAGRIAREKILPARERHDQTEEYPWEIVAEFRRARLFGINLPQAYGGRGLGNFEEVLVMEQLARACAGIQLSLGASSLCATPILYFGNAQQRARWLPDLASGRLLGAFAITEPGAGSDATATKATARREGGQYVLRGVKNFCTNGEAAEIYVVFASTNPGRGARGISAFVVEKGTPGFSFGKREHKMGIRASPTYELVFSDCRIPAENLLYRYCGHCGQGLAPATLEDPA